MSYDVEKQIAWLMSNVGYTEDDSGNTPWSDQWGYPQGAWCGMYAQSGVVAGGGTVDNTTGTIPHTELTNTGAMLFKEWGNWTTEPGRGYLVYFTWAKPGLSDNPDWWAINHVGTCVNFDNWPNYIETVEGNISNSVVNTIRYNDGQIVGFGRPNGAAITPTPAPVVPVELEDEVATVIKAPGKPVAWIIGSTVLFQSAPTTVTVESGPQPTVLSLTPAEWDKWYKTAYQPSLPKK